MLNIPPHLEACRPRGLFSIFHGTSSPVARRCPRASDLVLSAEHAFLLYERPGLHLQSGASAVGGVLHGARRSSRCFSFGAICDFNPRAPCGARRRVGDTVYTLLNFNPRTPCGVRRSCPAEAHWICRFQSTHPVRGATPIRSCVIVALQFQSTHPVRGATNKRVEEDKHIQFQSTHPVRGATRCPGSDSVQCAISIHAPRAGCDSAGAFWDLSSDQFQSTHPVRGATVRHSVTKDFTDNFNPRTPCGVRRETSPM